MSISKRSLKRRLIIRKRKQTHSCGTQWKARKKSFISRKSPQSIEEDRIINTTAKALLYGSVDGYANIELDKVHAYEFKTIADRH
jgi:hypothetical protein